MDSTVALKIGFHKTHAVSLFNTLPLGTASGINSSNCLKSTSQKNQADSNPDELFMVPISGSQVLLWLCIRPLAPRHNSRWNATVPVFHRRALPPCFSRRFQQSRRSAHSHHLLSGTSISYRTEMLQTLVKKTHSLIMFVKREKDVKEIEVLRTSRQTYCHGSTVDDGRRQPGNDPSHLFPSVVPRRCMAALLQLIIEARLYHRLQFCRWSLCLFDNRSLQHFSSTMRFYSGIFCGRFVAGFNFSNLFLCLSLPTRCVVHINIGWFLGRHHLQLMNLSSIISIFLLRRLTSSFTTAFSDKHLSWCHQAAQNFWISCSKRDWCGGTF